MHGAWVFMMDCCRKLSCITEEINRDIKRRLVSLVIA